MRKYGNRICIVSYSHSKFKKICNKSLNDLNEVYIKHFVEIQVYLNNKQVNIYKSAK
jgi:hypothetical protein